MKDYFIKHGYKTNRPVETPDPTSGKKFWNEENIVISSVAQYYVYKLAHRIAKKKNIETVLDIGCGIGNKLFEFFGKDFKIYGIDQPEAIEICNQRYKDAGTFLADNFESPSFALKKHLKTADIIICADIIEHLLDPDQILDYIKSFSNKDTIIILSTPERTAMRGKRCDCQDNPYHVREWAFEEFKQYISHSGINILEHKMMFANLLQFNWITIRLILDQFRMGRDPRTTQVIVGKSGI